MVALAILAILAIAGLVAYDTWRGDKDAKWHADAEREIALGREASRENRILRDSLARMDSVHRFALDSASLDKAKADSIANRANRRVAALRERIARIDTLSADTLRVIVVEQAKVIDSLTVAGELKDAAYRTIHRVATELREENRALLTMNDRLAARLDSAMAILERRPKPRPWWLPEFTVGITGCYCDGEARSGPGLTIGKTVRF